MEQLKGQEQLQSFKIALWFWPAFDLEEGKYSRVYAPCPHCPLMALKYFKHHLCASAVLEGGNRAGGANIQ